MLVCTLSGIIAVMLTAPASSQGERVALKNRTVATSGSTVRAPVSRSLARRMAFIPVAATDMPDLTKRPQTLRSTVRRERFERSFEPVETASVRALRLDSPARQSRGGSPLDARLTLRLVGDAGGVASSDLGVNGGIAGMVDRVIER
ncbi:hypothetical protein LZK98_12310 [Sphingomonas cannabina]|uniref:hypothetical protein n=1 Tax=Sphingomonas cannabina TaxID=2899123 RepID=UPI001F208D9C|nr:hypothetical protein [Sphingomonas cannabina]UIJ43874.1 hypothetical protein LZK98_12310 [Sphingomonas cannabina]